MVNVIRSAERGHADHGWLKAKHTFSFADYYNPDMMNFGPVRVINEDVIQPAQGFGTHPHQDMEILTYLIDGALEHKDSMGNGSVIRPGDVQRMTAGTGVLHSEFNHSATEPAHLLQIWILPEARGLQPGYEQTSFSREEKLNQWRLVASRDGRDGSVTIHQRAELYATVLEEGRRLDYALGTDKMAFLQVVKGSITADEHALSAGDALTLTEAGSLRVEAAEESELLLFDLG